MLAEAVIKFCFSVLSLFDVFVGLIFFFQTHERKCGTKTNMSLHISIVKHTARGSLAEHKVFMWDRKCTEIMTWREKWFPRSENVACYP